MNSRDHYSRQAKTGLLDDGKIRIVLLGAFILLAFAILTGRLFFLQLYHGEEHRKLVSGQSIRRVRNPGWRGSIYSFDRMLLAGNRTTYDLIFYPEEMRRRNRKKTIASMTECANTIASAIGRINPPGEAKFRRHLWISPGVPITVFKDLSQQEIARALEVSRKMHGVDLQSSALRINPGGKLAAHLIGFARPAEERQAEDREEFFYYFPDMIGKNGVEAACDLLPHHQGLGLRALPGRSVLQVNNVGYLHKILLGKVEPVNGNDVILTLDSRAQRIAEKQLRGLTGAFVVVDADNGDIICAASAPGYDLSRFSPRLDPEYYQKLLDDPSHPLINRAFQAIYPPGSTLKPLICLALMENGADPRRTLHCFGEVKIGDSQVRCQAHRYGGDDLDMEKALEKSCNSYMILCGIEAGIGKMAGTLHEAGIGRRSGVELPESSGTFPSNSLKWKLYRSMWNEHDTALLSIGQGLITMTPLQMALYAAALANGGIIWKPHLVHSVIDASGNVIFQREAEESSRIRASQAAFETVRRGMDRVVNAPGGSGRRAKVPGLHLYGKTGTAETGSAAHRKKITHFIGCVTYREKTYAAVMCVENGNAGGTTCAPAVGAFFEEYLLRQKQEP